VARRADWPLAGALVLQADHVPVGRVEFSQPELGFLRDDARQVIVREAQPRDAHRPSRTHLSDAAKESNLPSEGLPRPAGFEDRMGHQARAAPLVILRG
jgi:hypothetical protein